MDQRTALGGNQSGSMKVEARGDLVEVKLLPRSDPMRKGAVLIIIITPISDEIFSSHLRQPSPCD
jgi:hypothetical protein